jgi:hypothetical protein
VETWHYTSPEVSEVAKATFQNYVRARVMQLQGGCLLHADGVDLVFIGLDGVARVRFSKSKEGSHVSVTFPSGLKEKTSLIVAGLMAQKKLKAINKPADEIPKAKPFIPAFEVFKKYLAMDSFIQPLKCCRLA